LLAACTSSSTGAGDGAACVDIDAAAYDRSCAADSDCEIVPTGHLCTGSCGCGGEPIAKRALAKYQSATSSVKLEACPCASPGTARCVHWCAADHPAARRLLPHILRRLSFRTRLTSAGQTALKTAWNGTHEALTTVLANLSPADCKQMTDAMRLLSERIAAASDK